MSILPSSCHALLLGLILGCTSARVQASSSVPPSQAPAGFWDHWGDGRAELAGYRLQQPRYGELRSGEAVLVFVTETFTEQSRVKSDGGHDDELPVIKLNDIRDFQTGIYDYNLQTSAFVRLDGAQPWGMPTKLSFSMQDWCGHVYDQLIVDETSYQRGSHSYFDGEADRTGTQPLAEGGVFADALPILVRGLAGPGLEPGAERTLPLHARLYDDRVQHATLGWGEARLARSADHQEIDSVLGRVQVETWTLTEAGGRTTRWLVEVAAPHRIIEWRASDGEEGVLTGVIRSAYWRQSHEGAERLRGDLGLPARPSVAP